MAMEETTRVSLREVNEDDLPVLFDHQKDPVSVEMANVPARDHDAHMAHWRKVLEDGTVIKRIIVFDGEVAGHVVCWGQDDQHNVGYWLGQSFWGKGIATEALSLFLELVPIRPLHAYVSNHNVGSFRVLEKCGFTVEREDAVEKVLLLR
jgi:RimJ/RimL family protein N-acetyltransferase